jgi:hypothetical protein
LHQTHDGVLRDPAHSRQALDYWRFYNEAVSDAICWFARQIKEHTGSTRLVGAFYGYITGMDLPQWSFQLQRPAARAGRHKFDALFCPASYRSVNGQHQRIARPAGQLLLRGKLYFHEVDNTTGASTHPLAQALQRAIPVSKTGARPKTTSSVKSRRFWPRVGLLVV